jgi:hypothetical protein
MVRLPKVSRPVVLGVVLTLAVLAGAGGFAARHAANAAEPLEGGQLSARDVRVLVGAASSCTALTPARLAGLTLVASNAATGTGGLSPAQWEQNAPWSGAAPADREAAVNALAHLVCRLVAQARTVRIEEDPWRIALAAHRVGMDEVIKAGRIAGDAETYVETVEWYAGWYARQPVFGGEARSPATVGALVPVPAVYAAAVVAAGQLCTEMPPARVAAQIMMTSGFEAGKLGPAGEQGIAQFLPQVWTAHVESAASKSPWDPVMAIPALARTMCALIKQAGGKYDRALAAFTRADEQAQVDGLAEAVTKAEAEYAKDVRLNPVKADRDNQPALEAAGASGRSYGPYFILNLATSMCVDLPGSGSGNGQVLQWSCTKANDDNQEWTFEARAVDAENRPLYWIRNTKDGLCLTSVGTTGGPPVAELTEASCGDDAKQFFRLHPTKTAKGFQYYWLRNAAANRCVDVPGQGNGNAGERLILFPCEPNDDHDWALVQKSEW